MEAGPYKKEASKLIKRKVLTFEEYEKFSKLIADPIRSYNAIIKDYQDRLNDVMTKRQVLLDIEMAVQKKYNENK